SDHQKMPGKGYCPRPPAAGLRVRDDPRDPRLLPDQHRVPPHPASPARRRRHHAPRPPRAAVRLAARPNRPGRVMNPPPLRLARPGQLPAPPAGDDSLQILSEATDSLARLRTAYWPGDSAVHLHALASLIAQAGQLLPQPAHPARDENHPGPKTGDPPTPPPARAARRYPNKP